MTSLSARERRTLAEIERHLAIDFPVVRRVAWPLLLVSWVAAALLFVALLSGSSALALVGAAVLAGGVVVTACRARRYR